MSVFPTTSYTLIQKLAVEATGGNDAAWVRFFDLYTPAMKRFVQLIDHNHDPDDVVQEVYIHLVKILEEQKYKAEKAQFRTVLTIALVLRRLEDFTDLFKIPDVPASLYHPEPKKPRQRARKK